MPYESVTGMRGRLSQLAQMSKIANTRARQASGAMLETASGGRCFRLGPASMIVSEHQPEGTLEKVAYRR